MTSSLVLTRMSATRKERERRELSTVERTSHSIKVNNLLKEQRGSAKAEVHINTV